MIDACAPLEVSNVCPQWHVPTRRSVLLGMVGLAASGWAAHSALVDVAATPTMPTAPVDTAALPDWRAFAARFVSADGRVVDTGNGDVTHSEGQGYGLLFAERFDDRATFDRLLRWTRQNLQRDGNALHAWRFQPNAAVPVSDRNNATDGDLLIAWALLRAGERWGDPVYSNLGRMIGRDILQCCVRRLSGATLLLPAEHGFEHRGRVVVNPSYYIFPALSALAQAVPDDAWSALWTDALQLLRRGRFGRWQLPADWLQISGNTLDEVAPAEGWPTRFSWDAVRIPLNLVWAGLTVEPAVVATARFWASQPDGRLPAWADLGNDLVAPFSASLGVRAIASVASAASGGGTSPLRLPRVADAEDYYSAALALLSRAAWDETSGQSVTG